ncbi:MAG: hypothetical protein ACFFCY_01450 [Promethearchaeota archaeon]
MKKVSYSLRIGIIGNKEHIKEIFLDGLSNIAIDSNFSNNSYECLIVFKQIPIKINVFIADTLEMIIEKSEIIQKLDILILTINLYDKKSLNTINKNVVEEFLEIFSFQGLSVLVGMDIEQLLKDSPSKSFKISRFKLEKTTRDLNLIYCFEIFNKGTDINEIYNTLFNDFILRFQYSNPELFESAKEYGKRILH